MTVWFLHVWCRMNIMICVFIYCYTKQVHEYSILNANRKYCPTVTGKRMKQIIC